MPNITKYEDDIIDVEVSGFSDERIKGAGFAFEVDASDYEDIFEELTDITLKSDEDQDDDNDGGQNTHSIEDFVVIYLYENDLPYFVGDTQLGFFDKKNGQLHMTSETRVIQFADYKNVSLERFGSIENAMKQIY